MRVVQVDRWCVEVIDGVLVLSIACGGPIFHLVNLEILRGNVLNGLFLCGGCDFLIGLQNQVVRHGFVALFRSLPQIGNTFLNVFHGEPYRMLPIVFPPVFLLVLGNGIFAIV